MYVITDQYGLVAATPFQFGAGHVRPEMALDPGLVYDMGFQDYVDFLCASNYPADAIQIFTTTHNETVECPQSPIRVEDLNYPSFAVVFQQPPSLEEISVNMTRTVTNVGNANATYAAQIVRPADTQISVYPEVLSFSAVNEKKTFTLQVTTERSQRHFVQCLCDRVRVSCVDGWNTRCPKPHLYHCL
jgi:hypothetical protein